MIGSPTAEDWSDETGNSLEVVQPGVTRRGVEQRFVLATALDSIETQTLTSSP